MNIHKIEAVEYVFKLIGKEAPAAPVTSDEQDKTDLFIPIGWRESPLGSYSDDVVEWVSKREKYVGDDRWMKFGTPIVFSWPRAKSGPDSRITLNEIIEQAHETAKDKGWWDEPHRDDLALIALMHSELSEAVECIRRDEDHLWIDESKGGKPEGVAAEFADVIIRIADYCGAYGISLEQALNLKLEFNKTRPHRHGGKLA